MDNFIEKYFFSPDHLTVIEFLANYFINILAFVFPIFVLISIMVSAYIWFTNGARQQELKKIFVSLGISIGVVSVLLYTPGRKDIINPATGLKTKSYYIVDLVNDVLVLGSRFTDAFVYNLLFGKNYSTSNQPLFKFAKNGVLHIKNYKKTPNGEDLIDGYFVSGLQQLLSDKINKINNTKTKIEQTVKKNYNIQKKVYNKSIKNIKDFINYRYFNETLYALRWLKELNTKDKALYFKKFFKNNLKSTEILNYQKGLNQLSQIESILNSKMKNYNNPDYPYLLRLVTNTPNYNFLQGLILTSQQGLKKLSELTLTFKNNGMGDCTNQLGNIISNTFTKKRIVKNNFIAVYYIPYKFSENNLINISKAFCINNIPTAKYNEPGITKKALFKLIKNMQDDNVFYNPHDDSVQILADYLRNKLKIDFSKDRYYNINLYNIHQDYIKFDIRKIVNKYSNNPNFNFNDIKDILKKMDNNQYLNIDDAKKYINFYFLTIENNLKKQLFEIERILDKEKMDPLRTNENKFYIYQMKLFLENLAKNIVLSNNSINYKFIAQSTLKNMDYSNRINQNINKLLKNANTSFYYIDNGMIGDLKNNKYIKLKDLSDDYLFLKNTSLATIKTIKNNRGKNITIETRPDKINSFHWYNLGSYAIGLKNLYIQTNNFYTYAIGAKSLMDSEVFLYKCVPYYNSLKNVKNIDENIKNICFPNISKDTTNQFKTISQLIGVYKGIMIAIKTFFTTNKFTQKKAITLILSAIAGIGTYILVSFIVFLFLMFFYYLIPVLFFFISVISWVFKASIALITFGFSIILFLFDHKKQQLESASLHVIMYALMPIFITFMFFLIINTSFIMSITLNNVFPDLANVYGMGSQKNTSRVIKQIPSEIKINLEKQYLEKNASWWRNFFFKVKRKSLDIYKWANDKLNTSIDIISTFSLEDLYAMLFNIFFEGIKFLILFGIEIMLYTNLWKVDRFVNEVIGTNIRDTEFQPDKIVRNFGIASRFT